MLPLNVENLREISGLGKIWSSFPAAEFDALGRELAAEFDTRPFACVSIMKTHFIIDIITNLTHLHPGFETSRPRAPGLPSERLPRGLEACDTNRAIL
jgi:hypothetical protein